MNDIKLILFFSLIAATISTIAGTNVKKSNDTLTSKDKEIIKRYIYDTAETGKTEKDTIRLKFEYIAK